MQFFKFFFGIILVEIATVVLFYLSSSKLEKMEILQLIVPLIFIALMVSFWFDSLAGHGKKEVVEKMKDSFAKEREEIRIKAEKSIAKEAKVTHAKANFKVGAAFAGVLGVGGLFVIAQMVTAALLTLTAAGGVATGYFYRGKRLAKREEALKQLEVIDVKAIESK